MTPQPAGWYDDPQDPMSLRYWDGILWTEHVVPKRPANLDQSHLSATPQAPAPSHQRTAYPGQRQMPGSWTYAGPPMVAGMPLSGWWRRAGAFILDGILMNLIVTAGAWPFVQTPVDELTDWWQRAIGAAQIGDPMPTLPSQVVGHMAVIALTVALVHCGYDIIGLSRWGATIGRLATGIRVRALDGSGPLGIEASVRRSAAKFVGDLAAPLPVLSTVGTFFVIIDRLWPLRDPKRQSLHDKFAKTVVVRAPRRSGRVGP